MKLHIAWGVWLLGIVACGASGERFFQDSGADSAPRGDAGAFTLTVDPSTDPETVVIATTKSVSFHATLHATQGDVGTDVTSQAEWSADQGFVAVSMGGGVVTLRGVGGTTMIHATLGSLSASATLQVKATGPLFLGGADSSAVTSFAIAMYDGNPADAPAIEYPLDGVILPANLPPMEMQWTQAADNNLYDVHLTTPSTLDVNAYVGSREATMPANVWTAIIESSLDQPITWAVEATGPTEELRTSPSHTLTPTSDTIDQTAIYVWQSSTSTFHVLDIAAGTDTQLPATSTAFQGGCVGCHRISRDGKRMAFAHIPDTGAPIELATMSYDGDAGQFVQEVAATTTNLGSYSAFNPLESTEVPALLVAREDGVARNAPGNIRLALGDPDTNATVPSNVADLSSSLSSTSPGQGTTMPDWSPDGSFVVYAAYDNVDNVVRVLGEDIVLGSIVQAPVTFANGTFTFGTPSVLVAANASDNAATGVNNFLPSISPDGTVVAFTRATGYYPLDPQATAENLTGQIMIVRRSDQQVIALETGSNGAGTTMDSTWPQWAPTMGAHYAWLAYGSERLYGHELTPQNHSCGGIVQGQLSCKQLWVTAVDISKMQSGTSDPSSPPFWVPGQSINAQYVSPQWTKAVALNVN